MANTMPRILLVNPPIYDFAAHDFWLKPYGLLEVGGFLRGRADLQLFDYLDRLHPQAPAAREYKSDPWGRGKYRSEVIDKPPLFADIPLHFKRCGLARDGFRRFIAERGPFDFALVQTVMTYWYPGVKEVVADLRDLSPNTAVVLGGVYATLCPDHAASLGPDLVVKGSNLAPLWTLLGVEPDRSQPPLWEAYPHLAAGVIRLSDGCPFRCTYCSVPQVYGQFSPRGLVRCRSELESLRTCGAQDVAFYDDALLCEPETTLIPFLEAAVGKDGPRFHTPNALNARLMTPSLASLMVQAGVKTFYLGLESISDEWQKQAGGKVAADEFAKAVRCLTAAGADPANVTAYSIVGHPAASIQQLEETIRFVHELGIRVMLSEFSPVPGTPDGRSGRAGVNADEPLTHNKTAFTIRAFGWERIQELKAFCRQLNQRVLEKEAR